MRYTVPGVPAGPAKGITAFLPHMTRPAAGWQAYKYALHGSAGTVAVPVDPTPVVQDAAGQASMGGARSCDAPGAFWPQVWYQGIAVERPGAGQAILLPDPANPGPTALLPVPAVNLRSTYVADSARLARRALTNRIRQVPWRPRRYQAPEV